MKNIFQDLLSHLIAKAILRVRIFIILLLLMKMRFKELESFTYIHTGSIKVEALQTPYFQISHSFYNSRQTSLSSRVLTSAHGFWWALNTSTDHTLTMILRVCVCLCAWVVHLWMLMCVFLIMSINLCVSFYAYLSVWIFTPCA